VNPGESRLVDFFVILGGGMKRIVSVVAIVMLAAVAIVFGARRDGEPETSAADGASGERWEYLVVQGSAINFNPTGNEAMRKEREGFAREAFVLEQNMDKLGAKGWELVQASGTPADPVLYFKRKK
jgi:hypothetical protein